MAAILFFLLAFSGCEKQSLNDYFTEGKEINLENLENKEYVLSSFQKYEKQWLNMCIDLRKYGPIAMAISFIIGMLVYFLFQFEKTIQKFALFGMMIGFPVMVFIVIYTACYLYGVIF